ncbi:MAG: type VI secretion system ATPase TssH, partial [Lachnospiraceae bacterium]|nr:type VI secretion system ATPase TssH [Lachnospiraceae bacterium]
MNINKFTQKSIETIQLCEKLANDYGNSEVDQEHLAYALVSIDESLIAGLIERMGIDLKSYKAGLESLLAKKVKVTGNFQVGVSKVLNKVLTDAEDEAKAMGDSYVSVEHLFLRLIKEATGELKSLFKQFGINRESFLQVLSQVRGNQTVQSDNPEATYDTLKKYGTDLVERAKEGKLDPVIGRDSEIRNVIRILSRKT